MDTLIFGTKLKVGFPSANDPEEYMDKVCQISITDPRYLKPEEAEDEDKQSYQRLLVERNQLIVFCDTKDVVDDSPNLLRQILHAFPSERLLFHHDGTKKRAQQIMDCFAPERALGLCAGLADYTPEVVDHFADCFAVHKYYFEWIFCVYKSERECDLLALDGRWLPGPDDPDSTWNCVDYSIYLNEDMRYIRINCNREELFDDLISFFKTLELK